MPDLPVLTTRNGLGVCSRDGVILTLANKEFTEVT
jgi:hypothetical protein